jgi:hypothetical protein
MHRELICDAIQGRRLLEFRYKDEQMRVIEPHQIGETADGHELVLGWLVRGQADQTGWRLYRTADVTDLRALDENFVEPRPGFNPSARYFAITHCSLLPLPVPSAHAEHARREAPNEPVTTLERAESSDDRHRR